MKPRALVPLLLALAAVGGAVWWLVGRAGDPSVASAQDPPGEPAPRTVPVPPPPAPSPADEAKPAPPVPRASAPAAGDLEVIDRALASHSRPQLALLGELARAGVTLPPALDQLFERQRQGDAPEQLRRFVRARFPADLKLRMLTIRWINRQDPTRARPDGSTFRASGKPLPSLGSIERVEKPAPSR